VSVEKSGFTARFWSLLACWLVASLVSPDQVHAVAICGVGYTHISTQAARAAVELLNHAAFVDRFVDENGDQKILAGKLLN
jgi:hypothetical protein